LKEDKIYCEISDTGKGIPKDKQEIIFEKFVQADAYAFNVGGTGLGLAISRQFAKLMNGNVFLESAEGKGSVFTFYFQFACVENFNAINLKLEKKISKLKTSERQINILIADEIEINRIALKDVLFSAGFSVFQASERQELKKNISEIKPPVLLLNTLMYESENYEIEPEIAELCRCENVNIILYNTGKPENIKTNVSIQNSAFCLFNPISDTEILEEIKKVINIDYLYRNDVLTDKLFDLNNIPAELTDKLKLSAITGDLEELTQHIEKIKLYNITSYEYLKKLAEEFNLSTILNLLDKKIK
jgi:DNA-binding NarL/FixJ family response regulator